MSKKGFALFGGVIGAVVFGPFGAVAGAAIGAALGDDQKESDNSTESLLGENRAKHTRSMSPKEEFTLRGEMFGYDDGYHEPESHSTYYPEYNSDGLDHRECFHGIERYTCNECGRD